MLSVPMLPGCHASMRQTMVTTISKFDRVQLTIDEKKIKKSASTVLSRLFLVYCIEMTHSSQLTQAYLAGPKSNDKNGFFQRDTKMKMGKKSQKNRYLFSISFFFYLVFDVESD